MKWFKRKSWQPAIPPAPADDREGTVSLPLLDVWSLAVEKGGILFDKAACQGYLRTLASPSPPDREWERSTANPRPYIATLDDVVVIPGTRILIDGQGNARSDEISAGFQSLSLRPKLWDMELLEGPHLSFRPPPLAPETIPAGIHLMGEHQANYFHWFVEILPRLYGYLQLTGETDLPLLVSDNLHGNLYDLLAIVSGKGRAVKRLTNGLGYRVRKLVYPADISRIFDVYDRPPSLETTYLPVGLLKELVRDIRQALPGTDRSGAGPRRLFVKRTSTYRTLLNEAEVETFLAGRGFMPVDPGRLSVSEQVELFSRADIVVGPSGAALTNIVWCAGGARVLVLHADHPFKKYPYWDALARVSGAGISYLAGPRANNVQGLFEAHDDYSIPVDALGGALERLGC